MSLLSVRDLVVRYGRYTAVDGVSLDVRRGQVVAIIGPNGAGKTTCFNAINGQVPAASGSVRLDGREVAALKPEELFRLGVGRTFQITATIPSMTVRENVQMALVSHHRKAFSLRASVRTMYKDHADALLAAVGMEQMAEGPCGVLAYGDLKRLELAVALANEPRILLMDEPTAGMAPGERSALMALATSLARQRDVGILFTEHDMDIVFGHAEHLIVLNRGRCVCSGAPDAIRSDPRVREVYLGGGALAHGGATENA